MTSPVLSEHYHDGVFLVREADRYRSRDPGVIANAGAPDLVLDGGLVVKQNTTGGVDPFVRPAHTASSPNRRLSS